MTDDYQAHARNFLSGEIAVETEGPPWPPPITYREFKTQLVEQPRTVVENLLDGSSRMIFGGGSKTYKTWAMTDMALSINAGVPWWGFPVFKALCLYVNFELKEFYFKKRLTAIEKAKGVDCRADEMLLWNLRGHSVSLVYFKVELLKWIKDHKILVVIIDPFYKLLGDLDERVSATINPIMAAFDEINRETGATIIFSAHFTKGNQAGKESIDRISGGGSINRDPDSLITLTKHETDHAFTVDFTLRDFAPIEPFVVKWDYPLLVPSNLDPEKLKKANRSTFDPNDLYDLINENDDTLTTAALEALAKKELGWSRRTVFNKLNDLKKKRVVFLSKATDFWNVKASA